MWVVVKPYIMGTKCAHKDGNILVLVGTLFQSINGGWSRLHSKFISQIVLRVLA